MDTRFPFHNLEVPNKMGELLKAVAFFSRKTTLKCAVCEILESYLWHHSLHIVVELKGITAVISDWARFFWTCCHAGVIAKKCWRVHSINTVLCVRTSPIWSRSYQNYTHRCKTWRELHQVSNDIQSPLELPTASELRYNFIGCEFLLHY